MYRPGFNYVKAGVMLIDLQPQEQAAQADARSVRRRAPQPAPPPRDRARLMSAIDTLNQRFGRGAVDVASATARAARGGRMRRGRSAARRATPRGSTR